MSLGVTIENGKDTSDMLLAAERWLDIPHLWHQKSLALLPPPAAMQSQVTPTTRRAGRLPSGQTGLTSLDGVSTLPPSGAPTSVSSSTSSDDGRPEGHANSLGVSHGTAEWYIHRNNHRRQLSLSSAQLPSVSSAGSFDTDSAGYPLDGISVASGPPGLASSLGPGSPVSRRSMRLTQIGLHSASALTSPTLSRRTSANAAVPPRTPPRTPGLKLPGSPAQFSAAPAPAAPNHVAGTGTTGAAASLPALLYIRINTLKIWATMAPAWAPLVAKLADDIASDEDLAGGDPDSPEVPTPASLSKYSASTEPSDDSPHGEVATDEFRPAVQWLAPAPAFLGHLAQAHALLLCQRYNLVVQPMLRLLLQDLRLAGMNLRERLHPVARYLARELAVAKKELLASMFKTTVQQLWVTLSADLLAMHGEAAVTADDVETPNSGSAGGVEPPPLAPTPPISPSLAARLCQALEFFVVFLDNGAELSDTRGHRRSAAMLMLREDPDASLISATSIASLEADGQSEATGSAYTAFDGSSMGGPDADAELLAIGAGGGKRSSAGFLGPDARATAARHALRCRLHTLSNIEICLVYARACALEEKACRQATWRATTPSPPPLPSKLHTPTLSNSPPSLPESPTTPIMYE
jgi:hypothetical protein